MQRKKKKKKKRAERQNAPREKYLAWWRVVNIQDNTQKSSPVHTLILTPLFFSTSKMTPSQQ